jgi:hypothetical protein
MNWEFMLIIIAKIKSRLLELWRQNYSLSWLQHFDNTSHSLFVNLILAFKLLQFMVHKLLKKPLPIVIIYTFENGLRCPEFSIVSASVEYASAEVIEHLII